MPTRTQARQWLERWDRQQEFYLPDREERFEVVADVVAAVGGPRPAVLDLGAGPGSLSVRLLDRLADAQVIALDADALLLGLARIAYGDRSGLTIVEHDLRDPGWTDALAVAPSGLDAVVSTTALHWLTGEQLAEVYRQCAALLRPGGVFVDGDHFHEGTGRPTLERLTREIREARTRRAGTADNEDWESWWEAVGDAPELAELTAERGPRPIDHSVDELPSLADHERLLRDAGFAEVGTVWQFGDDRVLVGVR